MNFFQEPQIPPGDFFSKAVFKLYLEGLYQFMMSMDIHAGLFIGLHLLLMS